MNKEDYKYIRAIAFSFHRTTNVDLKDLIQEASIGYLISKDTYDPKRAASFKTHVYNTIKNRLIDYIRQEKRYQFTFLEMPYGFDKPKDRKQQIWEKLSYPSKRIAELVVKNQNEILARSPKTGREFVKEKMRQAGYNPGKIQEKLENLQKELQYN